MSVEANELLDAFKAAALSVTKLYKTSAAAQNKARSEGYQECLEELLGFLDRENIGLRDGEGQRIRRWVMERLDGREMSSPPPESDDEVEKPEPAPMVSPQMQRIVPSPTSAASSAQRPEDAMRDDSSLPTLTDASTNPAVEEVEFVVPTQETFTFQSSHPYPHDAALRLANLDLSDSNNRSTASRSAARNRQVRQPSASSRTSLGRGAGQKRKVNLAEIFDLGSLDYGDGKGVFGSWGNNKRTRLS
ncbi:uncharacterized protein CTHT_0046310 [Thermochaetoides thermophila DSM 1495]|uniref:Uncharacterized protein n=1 Tax=Chaetomium thermophilum (strain DSM 1495 / CBS 144.50 / IMI 039719) TaxID=759272 RepID=G0S9L4_CHATD|nr:hypothetical protein CTHT_0046310 [Thermochaetoides thermophila DSM 1495]EGS20125.1 hypothetical protein CTHT_0046310 [Thermochaetoides thermophila DSM 1495]